jgi:hypothetical protein
LTRTSSFLYLFSFFLSFKKNIQARITKLSLFKIFSSYTNTFSSILLASYWRQQNKWFFPDCLTSIGRNKWKSLEATSGLLGKWFRISGPTVANIVFVKIVICGWVLSCSRTISWTISQIFSSNHLVHIIAKQLC